MPNKLRTKPVGRLAPPELRKRIRVLSESIGQQYRELARHLDEVLTRKLYADWGFESFNQYLIDEVKISVRGGYYSIQVARRLREAGVTEAEAEKVSWSNLKEVATVIDKTNKKKWLAEARTTPARELAQKVRKESGGEIRHAIHFTLAEVQNDNWERALAKAKKMTGSDKIPWLVDILAMEFNAGGFDERGEALSHWIKELERVYNVKVLLVDKNLPNAEKVLKELGRLTKSDANGRKKAHHG